MKYLQYTVPVEAQTTFVGVWKWGQELERLYACIVPRFVRPEPRRRALTFLKGIVSATERKNEWQLAEHAGEACPDGMQRLLNQAIWDEDLVRDDLQAYILERLGAPGAVIVIDETSFRKRGRKSAGVNKQRCGTAGQVENCQVGVFLDDLLRCFSKPHVEQASAKEFRSCIVLSVLPCSTNNALVSELDFLISNFPFLYIARRHLQRGPPASLFELFQVGACLRGRTRPEVAAIMGGKVLDADVLS